MASVLKINDTTWAVSVLQYKGTVLVDFGAPWCAPCKSLARVVERLASEMGDGVRFGMVNIDESPNVTSTYGVKSVPTVMVFRNGVCVSRQTGVVTRDGLLKMVFGR